MPAENDCSSRKFLFVQMQSKLQELQEKLQAEVAENTKLVHKYEEIQNSCDHLKDQLNSNLQQQHEEEVCDTIT
jgi:predicted nuclease with TOPRIM domain